MLHRNHEPAEDDQLIGREAGVMLAIRRGSTREGVPEG